MDLKQSTAVTIKLGPFVDSTDGNTAETALTIQKADVRLSKNGGNMAAASADQGAADAGAPHDEIGYYDGSLDATDTDTLGRLKVMIHEAGALPVWLDVMIMPANVWDALYGADKLQVDVVEWVDTEVATPTVAGVPEVDVTHAAGTDWGSGAITAASIAADVGTEIATAVWAFVIETGHSALQLMRVMSAVLLGKATGLGTGAPVYRDVPDTKNRVTATTDGFGNRSAVTLDES